MNLSQSTTLKQAIQESVGRPSRRVLQTNGEGLAVVRSGRECVVRTVAFVEGVHFDLVYTSAREVGHRALAMALGKLAALGARPRYASIGVGLRQEQGEIFVGELYAGATALAKDLGVDLVAEHAFPSPSFLVVTVTVLGEPYPKVKRMREAGSKVGDLICTTGTPGASACGLALLRRMGRGEANSYPEARDAHLLPTPRLQVAEALARSGKVTAIIELRDGLARDLHRLTEMSGVGAILDQASLPVAPFMLRVASFLGKDCLGWSLYGGEDFELLFTLSPGARNALAKRKLPFSVIGEVRPKAEQVRLRNLEGVLAPLLPLVWSDYARRARTSRSA